MSQTLLTDAIVLKELQQFRIPFTSSELGKKLNASGGTLGKHLTSLERQGLIIQVPARGPNKWLGGSELVRKLVEAFPVMIAWYRRTDPKHAEFLEKEWSHLLERGFPQWEMNKETE